MRILIIGHSVEDHIHHGVRESIKPGGIYYSALGLSKISSSDDEIHLITALEKDKHVLFADVYNLINIENVVWVDEIPKVHLHVYEKGERTECFETIPKNLDFKPEPYKKFDGILINMISGFDISLEQLKELRKNFNGLIYFDVHSLSRGFDQNRTRVFRKIDNFDQWAKSIDILQANELESKTLSTAQDEYEIAKELFSYGVKIFIITKGEIGVRAYFMKDNELESVFLSAEKLNTVNKVGCGDIFGAVFFYTYIKTQNIFEALRKANSAAGKSVTLNNMNELTF